MKVKCINIFNEALKKFQDSSSWLTIGKEYIVFEMLIYPEKRILYRLASDDNQTPALFNSIQFEVTSGKIPLGWTINQDSYCLTFNPTPWKKKDFWENVFDGDSFALELYKIEARKMAQEEEE